MTKGLWIVIGVLVLQCLLYWSYEASFLSKNVWKEHRVEDASEIRREVDFLALGVVQYVSRSVGAAFTGLIALLVYLAIRARRAEQRVEQLEQALANRNPRPEMDSSMAEPRSA